MAEGMTLSVDPSGEWSTRQARKVLEIIEPEAACFGIGFRLMDVGTHAKPHRVIIVAHCLEHDQLLAVGQGCPRCMFPQFTVRLKDELTPALKQARDLLDRHVTWVETRKGLRWWHRFLTR